MNPTERETAPNAWGLALALAMVHLVSSIDRHLLALVLTAIKGDLQLSDTQLGFLQGTAYVLLYAVAVIPAGMLVDRFDRRRIVMAALITWSLGTAFCALAGSFFELTLARMVVGLGQAALVPAATSLIADGFGRGRMGRPIAVFTSAATFGRGLAFFAGGLFLAWLGVSATVPVFGAVHPWRLLFLSSLILNVVVLVLLAVLTAPQRGPKRGKDRLRLCGLLADWRLYLAYFGCAAATILAVQVVAAWAPTLLVRSFGLSAAASGVLVGPIVICFGPAGNLLGGWSLDRLTARGLRAAPAIVVALALTLAMIAAPIVCLAASVLPAAAGLAALTFCLGAATPAGLVAIQQLTPPALRGRVTGGFILGVTLISLGIGPVMVGWLSDHVFAGPAALSDALLATLFVVGTLGVASALAAGRLEAAASMPTGANPREAAS